MGEHLTHTPEMIGESTGHRGGDQAFSFARLSVSQAATQLMVRPAKVVGAANEPHPGLEPVYAPSSMPTPPSQTGQTFPHRAIEAFDKRRVQFFSSSGLLE